jgi:hypothetical protein
MFQLTQFSLGKNTENILSDGNEDIPNSYYFSQHKYTHPFSCKYMEA